MIPYLMQVFGNQSRAFEIMEVLAGIKPVARMIIPEHLQKGVENYCTSNKIAFCWGAAVGSSSSGGYSSKGYLIPREQNKQTSQLFYASLTKEDADRAAFLEQRQDHLGLGNVLGYPSCCCSFFKKHHQQEEQKNNDFVLPAFDNTVGDTAPFPMNIFGRYFDFPTLSHCPCSFHCNESLKMAERRLQLIHEDDPRVSRSMEIHLRTLAVYSDKGIFLFKGTYAAGRFRYTSFMVDQSSPIVQQLHENGTLTLKDHHVVGIMEGKDARGMVFE
ncbi:hypothetical protein HZB02_07725 [Candidatus Woesearchaeota archaeon]|nr:hypothetical protein [Candidatus Woesearchaeota archaeon]